MRTFIAVELSGEIRGELARLQGALKEAAADIKWVKPENIHLTLKFLGETDEAKIEKIKKILDTISSQNKSFTISLFRLGAFPTLDNPRVVWLGIADGCAEAEKIAGSIEEESEKIGFPKEARPFSAHLTLGRVKSGKNKTELKEKLLSLEARAKSCPVKHITLFRSTLTPAGPIYTPLHEAGLKNGLPAGRQGG